MMTALLAFLLLAIQPVVPTTTVDLAELNHSYCSDNGSLRFDQIIWWEQDPDAPALRVVDWRLLKTGRADYDEAAADKWRRQWLDANPGARLIPQYVPPWTGHAVVPQRRGEWWVSVWHDDGELRRVRSRSYIETWTANDPEQDDRELWPTNARRGLR